MVESSDILEVVKKKHRRKIGVRREFQAESTAFECLDGLVARTRPMPFGDELDAKTLRQIADVVSNARYLFDELEFPAILDAVVTDLEDIADRIEAKVLAQ